MSDGKKQFLGRLLVGTVGVAFVAFAVWQFADTLMTASSREDVLNREISEREDKLAAIKKDEARLKATIKRSLPSDPEVARQEYDAAINKLLRDAKVPVAAFSVKPKAADGKPAPDIAPKKPAFTRLALEITLKPIDYATLIDVLQRYYRLNLLQQITRFTAKKIEGSTARPRSSTISDRADLDVSFVTEAIILDGAENRRSLLPVPFAVGAAGGGAIYQTVMNTPEPSRGLNPLQLAQIVAAGNRDYTLMLVKDVFHGPPPPPLPPQPKPKEDTSAYIRMTGVGRNSDGTGTAFIEDAASKQEYLVDITREGGKLVPMVTKFYYSLKGTKKSYAPEPELDISESSSGTAKTFRVVGLDGDGLLLALKDSPDTGTAPNSPGGQTGKRPGGSTTPKTPPMGAVAGGSVMLQPQEKFYLWQPGDTLKTVLTKELSPSEALKAIARVNGAPLPAEASPVTAPAPRKVEAAAPPNERIDDDGR